MGAIKKRQSKSGKVSYQAEVTRRGFPRTFKTFSRLTDAKRWIQDVESGFRTGRFVNQNEATKHTLGEAIDRYIEEELPKKPRSYNAQKRQLLWFKTQLGFKLLCDVTPSVLNKCKRTFLAEEIKKGVFRKPQTWNRYQAALSCVYQMCCGEWEWMELNPARRVKREKEPKGRVRFLSDEERESLLEACKECPNPNLYPLVVLTLSTGMRRGEVRNLKWDDVDLKAGAIVLHETKNNERRRLPVKGLALELLKEHSKVRRLDTNFVFAGQLSHKTGIGWEYRELFEKAVEKAELKNFVFHDLRHSCASYLAMNGASLLEIAEVLGHKTLQMVKRYSHLAEGHTAGVVERMNEKIPMLRFLVFVQLLLSFFGSCICLAQELEPRRWSHLPMNTNILGVGYAYTDSDIFFDPTLRLEDVDLEMHTVALRYIRTFELFGKSARAEILPIYQDGKWTGLVDGEQQSARRVGFADPVIRFAINLLGAPPLEGENYQKYKVSTDAETIVGAGIAVHLPIGEYHEDKLLNLGANRFLIRPQLGVVREWGSWSVEVTGSTWFYTKNDEFFGETELENDPYYAAQSQLVYTITRRLWLAGSVGYGIGAESEIDGESKDDEKESVAWALSFGFPIAKGVSGKIAYVGSNAQNSVGSDTETLSLAVSHSW